jgi:hypothetical protein
VVVLDEQFGYQALEARVFCLQFGEGFGGVAMRVSRGAGLIWDLSLRGFWVIVADV